MYIMNILEKKGNEKVDFSRELFFRILQKN